MLLILRSFSARETGQNPWHSAHGSACPPLRVTSHECLVTSKTCPSVRPERQGRPQSANRDRAPAREGFEIENLIERLEKSRVGAGDLRTPRYERSQEVVENKGKCFFNGLQSQEVYENK